MLSRNMTTCKQMELFKIFKLFIVVETEIIYHQKEKKKIIKSFWCESFLNKGDKIYRTAPRPQGNKTVQVDMYSFSST